MAMVRKKELKVADILGAKLVLFPSGVHDITVPSEIPMCLLLYM